MRKPKPPPALDTLHNAVSRDPEHLVRVLNAVHSPLIKGRYLHWDQVRRRKPPDGLSHEAWWWALKFVRRSSYRTLPLADTSGDPFRFILADPIAEALHKVDLTTGGSVGMPDQITNPDTRDRYYVSSLIEEAVTSSQLEGATTTRQVAEEMIRTGRRPRDRSEQMILNNYHAMRRIGEIKDKKLTLNAVLELHRVTTERTLDNPDTSGRFRSPKDGRIVVANADNILHQPPPPGELSSRQQAMCDFANEKTPNGFLHPVIRSIALHFWLAYDHPFVDGNGRVARALFYWSMLRHGYWLFEFVAISRILLNAPSQYARSFLLTETDENDLTYFVDYQLSVILRAIDQLNAYVERKTQELRSLEQKLKGIRRLNHRQRALISHALRHPNQVYTIRSHQASHDVTHQTSRSDLLALKKKGLLEGEKVGKTWEFRPAQNLEKKLS